MKKIKKYICIMLMLILTMVIANPVQASEISTKITTKKVKIKKASKKTYTKKLPAQRKKSSKITRTTTSTIKKDTVVVTQVTEKYTKNSNIKMVKTIVTTTVTTAISPILTDEPVSIASAAPLMDNRVITAYQQLGFTIKLDPTANYSGYFSAKDRSITLRRNDDTIYHELGHFLGFIAGNIDKSTDFVAIYNKEKGLYTGTNKAYVTQNSSEYFAESVKDYVKNQDVLKNARPLTYNAIKDALNKITESQIAKIKLIYGPVWKI